MGHLAKLRKRRGNEGSLGKKEKVHRRPVDRDGLTVQAGTVQADAVQTGVLGANTTDIVDPRVRRVTTQIETDNTYWRQAVAAAMADTIIDRPIRNQDAVEQHNVALQRLTEAAQRRARDIQEQRGWPTYPEPDETPVDPLDNF